MTLKTDKRDEALFEDIASYFDILASDCEAMAQRGLSKRENVTGGGSAILQLCHHDGDRRRVVTAYVGEDGIKAHTPYRLRRGQFVEAGQ